MYVCIGVCVRAGRHVGTCKSNAQNCSPCCCASFMLFFFHSWEVSYSSTSFSSTFLLTQLVNCIVVCVCVCVRICLVIKCAQQQWIGLYLLAISMRALVLVAKQRCFGSYSHLFSPSLMLAICPAALTAKAATTAIDNKRRAPSTSPSSLALSVSLPLRLRHFTFRFMNGDNDEEAAESKRPKNRRHIFIYAKYTREEANVERGMKQNQVEYTKIKWQKSKVLLLYSLSFSIARFVWFSIAVWSLVLFDTTRRQSISFIHDSWIGVESFSHFFASVFVAVVGNSRRRRRQIKCQKNFTIVFSVTLYLHTQLIYACFLLFLFIICDVFFYCVLYVHTCVCVFVCYLIWHNPQ